MAARRSTAPAGVMLVVVVVVVAVIGCYDFTFVEPADAGTDAPVEAACSEGRLMCGSDGLTLERCEDGGSTRVVKCGGGCADPASPTTDAACKAPMPCVAGGSYCGGDKLDGDPDLLYRCAASGEHTVLVRCARGACLVQPGRDDRCR